MTTSSSSISDRLTAALADPAARVHFVGVAGSGMSALAHHRALSGGKASGSDRDFDRGLLPEERRRCARLGIDLFIQDGAGVDGAALVVQSTAVESAVPDLIRAREIGVPVAHRAEWLAALVASRPTIAIGGTSGKSTVVAMTFEALRGAGLEPGVVTGGDLRALQDEGHRGNAWAGAGPLVIEADESDKSIVRYAATVAVVLNLQRDHDEIDATAPAFAAFLRQAGRVRILGEGPALDRFRDGSLPPLRTLQTGSGSSSDYRAEDVRLGREGSVFMLRTPGAEPFPVALPVPGRHNVENAVAALAAAAEIGADVKRAAAALARFRGVARRLETVGRPRGAEVVDDFAHNPAKIAAAIGAVRLRARRVFAFFQPHGFGPTRFLRKDLAAAFASSLGKDDRVYFGDIYFAGGTAAKDISSADLAADLCALGVEAHHLPDRRTLADVLRTILAEGDVVLMMGARDPSLHDFAKDVAVRLA